MEFLNTFWSYICMPIILITVLVFVHEMGHYLVARRNGVRIEVFSVGFGPELYGWTDKANTRWKISAVPLGGYVKMFGEGDEIEEEDGVERDLTPEERDVSFHHKRLGQRAAIVAAGPIVNYVFAAVLFAALFAIAGKTTVPAAVGEVMPASAAEDAGFKGGDLITAIDGTAITSFNDLKKIVSVSPGILLSFTIDRDGKVSTLEATPRRAGGEASESKLGLLGVTPDQSRIVHEKVGVVDAVVLGVGRTYTMTSDILAYIGQIFSGARTAKELGGPLRIAKITGDMAQVGFENFIFIMAALSVNLGLINLFPIPMLDGGHLVYYFAELVRGRPLGPRAQEYGFRIGLSLVLLLMLFVTWNDLIHLKVFDFFRQLVS